MKLNLPGSLWLSGAGSAVSMMWRMLEPTWTGTSSEPAEGTLPEVESWFHYQVVSILFSIRWGWWDESVEERRASKRGEG